MYREFFFNLPKNHLDRKAVTSMEHRQDMQEVQIKVWLNHHTQGKGGVTTGGRNEFLHMNKRKKSSQNRLGRNAVYFWKHPQGAIFAKGFRSAPLPLSPLSLPNNAVYRLIRHARTFYSFNHSVQLLLRKQMFNIYCDFIALMKLRPLLQKNTQSAP